MPHAWPCPGASAHERRSSRLQPASKRRPAGHSASCDQESQQRHGQKIHLEKNVAMAGGALLTFFLFNQFGPEIGLTIGDGRLFPQL